ncbi:MAG: hypothetical protein CL450_07365 [Acidimicrobiaceae bacterium]|nr:hypothetical protein [Acidimicrobiaceae bacterium]
MHDVRRRLQTFADVRRRSDGEPTKKKKMNEPQKKMEGVQSVRAHLRALSETLDQIEASKEKRFRQLEHVERCVEAAKRWPSEPVPLSKESIVRELGNRVLPVLSAVLEVLREQQSRIEVLELAVIQKQQSDLGRSVQSISQTR